MLTIKRRLLHYGLHVFLIDHVDVNITMYEYEHSHLILNRCIFCCRNLPVKWFIYMYMYIYLFEQVSHGDINTLRYSDNVFIIRFPPPPPPIYFINVKLYQSVRFFGCGTFLAENVLVHDNVSLGTLYAIMVQ